MKSQSDPSPSLRSLEKTPTGISGFDEITGGGFPKGRPALIAGGAGCGKTLFSIEFIVRGAREFNEPDVIMAFEETREELTKNVASLGFDLDQLIRQKKLVVDYIHIERSEIQETGEFDLEGLFIRLNHAIDSIGAKRVVLDTLEALFSGLPNELILRAELRRLFRWLKAKGVTAVITAERGEGSLTRYGLEEYVADCVVSLDNRVIDQISTRRLRVLKYRGSVHGSNEYPFLIGEHGISVLPSTSVGLTHQAGVQRVSSGIARLDTMLGGRGYYRGSSVLVSGTAGSGKSTLAAKFAAACCARGEKALYFAFEESPAQITRNMRSVGIDLAGPVRDGLLKFHAVRPAYFGLEMHLVSIHETVKTFQPNVAIFDPLTNLTEIGSGREVKAMLTRLIDFMKMQRITAFFTSLTEAGVSIDQTSLGISSLMDTWIVVRNMESGGERNRALYVLKARGLGHSNQVREFVISNAGLDLVDVYVGDSEVLFGSARVAMEAREQESARAQKEQARLRQLNLERHRKTVETQIAALQADLDAREQEARIESKADQERKSQKARIRHTMAHRRSADVVESNNAYGK
ncbi:MAG TPA: circadian clock protein KaiC [Candidatus Baltobacteraceae bacterium]|nr:circadian clock protein KaiC [Candidatus Baltobacteraceae bacterium]